MTHIAVILFSFFIISYCRHTYDVPVAVWCGDEYVTGKNVGVSQSIVAGDVEAMIQAFFSSGPKYGLLAPYFSEKDLPEVVVLFVESQMRSEQLSIFAHSLPHFKEIMRNAESSLYSPFLDLYYALDNTVVNVAYTARIASGRVLYFGKGSTVLQDILSRVPSTVVNGINDLEKGFKNNYEIFSNGIPDLVIVHIPPAYASATKFTDTDFIINNVNSLISAETDEYVCVYTALAYDDPQYNMEFGVKDSAKRYLSVVLQSSLLANGSSNSSTNASVPIFRQYFGGWFWELFIVMFVIIPLLIMGTYAIDSIQTPLFDAKPKAKSN